MPLTYYLQPCPICGRRLQVRVEYLGRQVICYHCCGSFIASDPDLDGSSRSDDYLNTYEPAMHESTAHEPIRKDRVVRNSVF